MSWNDSMIKQAKKIIKMYPQKRSAIGPLLHLAQSQDGYISDDSIAAISELVGITEVQVKSVSTFYSMYKQEPTGKYLLSCLLYTSPSPRDAYVSRMPSAA